MSYIYNVVSSPFHFQRFFYMSRSCSLTEPHSISHCGERAHLESLSSSCSGRHHRSVTETKNADGTEDGTCSCSDFAI